MPDTMTHEAWQKVCWAEEAMLDRIHILETENTPATQKAAVYLRAIMAHDIAKRDGHPNP